MINVENRKIVSPIDKLAIRFNCHVGSVIAIDRNPFATKNFLNVGDWIVKIWTDDIKEDSLITIRLDPFNLIDLKIALRIKATNFSNLKSLGIGIEFLIFNTFLL